MPAQAARSPWIHAHPGLVPAAGPGQLSCGTLQFRGLPREFGIVLRRDGAQPRAAEGVRRQQPGLGDGFRVHAAAGWQRIARGHRGPAPRTVAQHQE
ncbi:hypothetical protein NHF46_06715 [Arthrobacter alpinus]|nr:hypothetical protein [Arthrobacter alpinus]